MASQKREREEELELQARRHQDALTEALALFTKKLELAQPRAAAPDALGAPPGHVDPRVLSMQGAIITPSQAPQPRSGSTFTTSGVADLAPSQPEPGSTYLAQGTPPTPQPRHVDTVAAGVQISLQSSSNTTISGVNAPSLPGPGSTHLVQGTQLPPQPWLVDTVATGVLPALQPRPDTLASGVPHTHTQPRTEPPALTRVLTPPTSSDISLPPAGSFAFRVPDALGAPTRPRPPGALLHRTPPSAASTPASLLASPHRGAGATPTPNSAQVYSPSDHGPPAKRPRIISITEPTPQEIRAFRANLVDNFCNSKRGQGYDRDNPTHLKRIETEFYTLEVARTKLINLLFHKEKKRIHNIAAQERERVQASNLETVPSQFSPPQCHSQRAPTSTPISQQHSPDDILGHASPSAPQPSVTPALSDCFIVEPVSRLNTTNEEDPRRAGDKIRSIITESLQIRGLEPAILPSESKQVRLDSWDNPLQGVARPPENRLAWPIHWRVNEIAQSISSRMDSLADKESKAKAMDYSRIPPSMLPDPGQRDYILQSAVLPGWTGKLPQLTDPFTAEMRTTKEPTNTTINLAGLRESAQDWRTTLSHTSVLSHALDALAQLGAGVSDDKQQMLNNQLDIARCALSKMIILSTKNIANHTLFERHLVQAQHMCTDLTICTKQDLTEMRLAPINDTEHILGDNKSKTAEIMKKRRDERRITFSLDTRQVTTSKPFTAGAGGGKSGSYSKPKQGAPKRKQPQQGTKPQPKADKPEQKPKAAEETAKKTDSTAAKKRTWNNKSKKKPATSKSE